MASTTNTSSESGPATNEASSVASHVHGEAPAQAHAGARDHGGHAAAASSPVEYQRWGDQDAVFRHPYPECKTMTIFGRTDPGSSVPKSLTIDARFCEGTEAIDLGSGTVKYHGQEVVLGDKNLAGAWGGSHTTMIAGGDGNDDLRAGSGGSMLSGGLGADWLSGGDGMDHFSFASLRHSNLKDGYDSIYDFQCGEDKIVISREGWFPSEEDGPVDQAGALSELMTLTDRGNGWWQVTASPDSRGNPDFFLMVKPNCPSGQLTYDDFSIV